ncbi:hypothetical protein AAG906_013382 [Vitis piasezkii]
MEPHQEGASMGDHHFNRQNYSHWKCWIEKEDQLMLSSLSWNGIEVIMKLVRTMLEPSTCTLAKEAWDILQVTHEGTNAVKVSKLQMLTSRFETIRLGRRIMRTFESSMQN